jgi:hypothetical protein
MMRNLQPGPQENVADRLAGCGASPDTGPESRVPPRGGNPSSRWAGAALAAPGRYAAECTQPTRELPHRG